jgi:serine/threonine protein kinase
VQNNGPVCENQSRQWMLQLVDALAYIHGKGIAHRDLKLENILLFDQGILKIADYSFCKQVCTYYFS